MTKTVPPALQVVIREAYRALMQNTGGAQRQGQKTMIGEIANAVANSKHLDEEGSGSRLLVVQAPTGSGKTFAYALGAIPIALANGLKVVIATATVQLQEQLFSIDMVELRKVIPEMVPIVVKGRHRLCCPAKLAQVKDEAPGSEEGVTAERMLADLAAGAWTGDVDELKDPPKPAMWMKFTNDRNGCVGRKCSSFDACPYYKTRKAIEMANVYIANQDLVLADMQAGNVLLPKLADTCLIIDEAHHLPSKALKSLANEHALDDARTWVMRAGKLVAAIRSADRHGPLGQKAREVIEALEVMGGTLCEAQMVIGQHGQASDVRDHKRPVRFAGGRLPSWLERVAESCRATAEAAKARIIQLMELLQGEDAEALPPKRREYFASEVGNAVGRIERIVGVWRLMTEKAGPVPVAKWLEISGEERDIRVCASPVGVGEFLHDAMWSKVACSIHLSATMTTVGGFDMHLNDTGLSKTQGVRTLEVASPFDYAANASLVIPGNVRNPKDVDGHTEDLAAVIVEGMARLGEGKGALCLFASWKQLEAVAALMPKWVSERLLKQGTMPKRSLLEAHSAAVRDGHASVLFGTSSLEEGVDLRGELCALVVIAKLQFSVPTDPVSEARREHMEGQGRDFFSEVVVPEATRRLAQSAGRLLRSEKDKGCVIVADPRLSGTGYGRKMIAALPAFRLTTSMTA